MRSPGTVREAKQIVGITPSEILAIIIHIHNSNTRNDTVILDANLQN